MAPFFIGEKYQYTPNGTVFKLKAVVGSIFHFECGHWCTDNVFEDLTRVKTGVVNWKMEYQLKLNL